MRDAESEDIFIQVIEEFEFIPVGIDEIVIEKWERILKLIIFWDEILIEKNMRQVRMDEIMDEHLRDTGAN